MPNARISAALAGLAATLLAVILIAGPFGSSRPTAQGLHVTHPANGPAQLTDAQGRSVLLRGVAVTALIQYAAAYRENPPVSDADFAEMAALGLNFVRLPVSWSRIAPEPGHINAGYLTQVAATARAAERHGLYVLIDMHLDRYGMRVDPEQEADGAPGWAILVASSCPQRPGTDDCTRAAWQSFWENRPVAGVGLQQRYISALEALAQAVRGQTRVAGLELMNNPSSGGAAPGAFEAQQLWPFYRRAIGALRGDGVRIPLWIDRAASSETTDALPPRLPGSLPSEGDLVLAPHDYAGVFSSPAWPAGGAGRLTQWYATAVAQARSLHMALMIGEWGAQPGGDWDSLLSTKLALQNRLGIGSSFWMWKQRPGFYNWYLVNLDGGLRGDTARAQLLSAPHPDALPGRLLGFSCAGSQLVVDVDGPGGTATLWSGTRVSAGGSGTVGAPVPRVTVDRRAVAVSLQPQRFASRAVTLGGELVSVRVSAGRHTLVLRSG